MPNWLSNNRGAKKVVCVIYSDGDLPIPELMAKQSLHLGEAKIEVLTTESIPMSKIPVLIVGAGPSGLMMACQCARFGLPFRIIDSKSGPTRESRAMVTHCRSLEAYDQLEVTERAYEQGHEFQGIQFYTRGQRRTTAEVSDIGKGKSKFSSLLTLEQSKNEQILLSKLNQLRADVEWGTSFHSMEAFDTHCNVTLSRSGSENEVIEAEWVIACDGAKSPVRHSLDLPFRGGTYAATFYVADADVTNSVLRRDYGSVFFSEEGFALAFPMEGSADRFRLVGVVPSEVHENPGWLENPDFGVIRAAFSRIMQSECNIHDPNWFTTYSVHHRKVDNFRVGRVILVGDAAHVHSPAGGQGMNTGLLDAHNLGWKLAYHVQGKARESIIDTYNDEREPFARQLLRSTDKAFQYLSGIGGWSSFLRLNLLPWIFSIVLSFKCGRDFLFKTVSQIRIAYPNSSMSRMEGRQSGVKAGDRFPAFPMMANGTLVDWSLELFREPGFYALDFTKKRGDSRRSMLEKVAAKIKVPVHYIDCFASKTRGEGARVGNLFYIVRPDMYVGFTTSEPTESKILEYFFNSVGLVQ